MKKHNSTCKCDFCKLINEGYTEADALKILEEKQEKILKEMGYIVHYVTQDEENSFVNYHTHGLEKQYGHPELQIVLPIEPSIASGIIHNVVQIIKSYTKQNKQIEDGEILYKVIMNYPVKFMKKYSEGKPILRILLPDENSKFPGDIGCDAIYELQKN